MKKIFCFISTALFSLTIYANDCATYYKRGNFDKALFACEY